MNGRTCDYANCDKAARWELSQMVASAGQLLPMFVCVDHLPGWAVMAIAEGKSVHYAPAMLSLPARDVKITRVGS